MILASLFVAVQFTCSKPDLVNRTDLPWNKHDYSQVKVASNRCKTLYDGRSPCLKVFIKKGFQDYSAICGRSMEDM